MFTTCVKVVKHDEIWTVLLLNDLTIKFLILPQGDNFRELLGEEGALVCLQFSETVLLELGGSIYPNLIDLEILWIFYIDQIIGMANCVNILV